MDLTQIIPAEFEHEGFLSPRMSKIPNEVRKAYPEWFDFARSANKLCQEALYQIDVKNADHPGMARSLLYLHNLQIFQSAVICLENGMTSQAQILIRTMIETLFKLKAISADPINVRQYGIEAIISQISFGKATVELHKISNGKHYTKADIKSVHHRLKELADKKKEIGDELRKLTNKKKEVEVEKWQIKEWATKANLVEFYLLYYQLLCQPVHAGGSHIESFTIKNNLGDFTKINPLPKFKMIDAYMHLALNTLLLSLQCVEKLTKKARGKGEFKTRIKQAFTKLNKLDKSI